MIDAGTTPLSICVATRDRSQALRAFLSSLETALAALPGCEVIVVDNGSSDDTPGVLQSWSLTNAKRRTMRVDTPGKSRAMNAAVAMSSAALLAFTDDDVEVDPAWAWSIHRFFIDHRDYVAGMGRVHLPPALQNDAAVCELVDAYRTIPLFDRGDKVRDLDEMYGANMAVRRSTLLAVGGFDERLGPGAGSLSDDLELARRIRQVKGRIGYMPNAVVYHTVDRSRLTPAYLLDFQRRLGLSELVTHPRRGYWHTLPRLAGAVLSLGWYSAAGSTTQRIRAWGRLMRHREVLKARWQARRRAAT